MASRQSGSSRARRSRAATGQSAGSELHRAPLGAGGLGPSLRLTVSRQRAAEVSTFATSPLDACERTRLAGVCRWSEPNIAPALDVLDAELDVALCLGGGPWDYAALVVLVEEAGGCYSAADGSRRIDTGSALLTNGGPVHSQILEALAPKQH